MMSVWVVALNEKKGYDVQLHTEGIYVYRTQRDPLRRVKKHPHCRHYVVFHRSGFQPFRDQPGSKVFGRKLPL